MRYTVSCRRVGGWWAISVGELRGVHSQARRLDQVQSMAREAIALMLDVAPDSFDVEVIPAVPAPVTKAVKARANAQAAEQAAEQATQQAVLELLADGYTVRDAGALLGLSPQRISQIATTAQHRQAA
jgi:predicted RNase H-like HicB family nuclease